MKGRRGRGRREGFGQSINIKRDEIKERMYGFKEIKITIRRITIKNEKQKWNKEGRMEEESTREKNTVKSPCEINGQKW